MTALEAGLVAPSQHGGPDPIVHARPVDEAGAAAAVGDLLIALGLNPADPGLTDTPRHPAHIPVRAPPPPLPRGGPRGVPAR